MEKQPNRPLNPANMNPYKGCPLYASLAYSKQSPKVKSEKKWIRNDSGQKVCTTCKHKKSKKHKTGRCKHNHLPVEPVLLLWSLLLFVAPSIHQRKEESDQDHGSQDKNSTMAAHHEEWDKLVLLEATMTAKQVHYLCTFMK